MIHAWANGAYLPADEAPRVSILDRGYALGDSIFETMRVRAGTEIGWPQHFDLLEAAAETLSLSIPWSREKLGRAARELAQRCDVDDVTLRITVSRGEGGVGVSPRGCTTPFVSIVARPTTGYAAVHYEHGIDSRVVTTRRIPSACLDARFKTGCYLPSVLGKIELDHTDHVEGVMLTVDGAISSGCVSNVFFVIDGQLRTPDRASDCREGVTRSLVLAAAERLGVPTRIERIELAAITRASEMFFTNTLMECLPVRSLGEQRFSAPGPITRTLLAALRGGP